MDLLDRLQAVENALGRVKLVEKGPRIIDLDILAYNDESVQNDRLVVPHRLMWEREFVLRPLRDIAAKLTHPDSSKSLFECLEALDNTGTPISPLTPLTKSMAIRSLDSRQRTHIMSILNLTPDSFSDGGANTPTDTEALKAKILAHIAAGATIIDIGGQSSRPNAPVISAEEELSRILPAIRMAKSLPEACNIAISVDTYRASVASAAVEAGADIINDISAGLLDPDMFPTIAHLGCTYIMTHMRGTPATMQNAENTTYHDPFPNTVSTELRDRRLAAENAGIRRWRIILDPGFGFAKTTEQNLALLGRLGQIRSRRDNATFPWLVGTSRKRFIGDVTGVDDAADRVGGTAATVALAVLGGAQIVRVHDVEAMRQVVLMVEAVVKERVRPPRSGSSVE